MAMSITERDLDNTLYRETPEMHDLLDSITAEAVINDLHIPLDFETAKAMVTESNSTYRDIEVEIV